MRMRVKLLIGFVTFVLFAGLIFFYIAVTEQTQQKATGLQDISEQVSSLDNQKKSLETELQEIESQYAEDLEGTAVMDFLFTDISENFLYNTIYPQFSDLGWQGLIAVTSDAYPGMTGCIDNVQLSELLASGWELCWQVSAGIEPDIWLQNAEQILTGTEMEAPEVIYLPNDVYSADSAGWDTALKEAGVSIRINEILDQSYSTDDTVLDDTWVVNSCGWYDDNTLTNFDDTIQLHNTIVLVIGGANDTDSARMYRSDEFPDMISAVQYYMDSYGLQLMGLQAAYEYRYPLAEAQVNGLSLMDESTKARMEQLQSNIAELETRITALEEQAEIIMGN